MIVGRKTEQEKLLEAKHSEYSQFIAVYGRRRVGKTFLIRETFDYTFTFQHTGLAKGKTSVQLENFRQSLIEAGYDNCPHPKTWLDAFNLLKIVIKESKDVKKVIFIDELPWLDTPKSDFMMALEHFWNGWATARKDILLIVCGSATSWIISKIIHNHGGLHNRLTGRILLQPFSLSECEEYAEYLGLTMSREQILENYMIMGGIPYYWSFMSKSLSQVQNIDAIFFARDGQLRNEFSQLYASLFKKEEPYIAIVTALAQKKVGLTRSEIIESTGLRGNGGLTRKLSELEECGFIRKYSTPGKKAKDALYQLIDNYTIFYFRFIQSNVEGDEHFWQASLDAQFHRVWEGLAFERVVLQHIPQVKKALGISGMLSNAYSWRYQPDSNDAKGAQIDLVIDRRDKVINLCEMKYTSDTEYVITKDEDAKLRNKRAAYREQTKTKKAIHLTMITPDGVKRNSYWNDIQSEVTLDDLFQ